MIVELSVVPLGVGESLSEYVTRAVKVIEDSDVEYRVTPMGTILRIDNFIELGKLLEKIKEELRDDCPRLYFVIKVDERFKEYDMEYKVRSVEEKLKKLRD
jgi:uncharacterized protein (TIGR00106 family)